MNTKTEESDELSYLTWFRNHAPDYFGNKRENYLDSLNERFKQETGKEIPKEWRDE